MSRSDRLALLLALAAILAAFLVGKLVYQEMPHIEDEVAYAWQADAAALGHLALPSPPRAQSMLIPFVVDANGLRFGKYPPAWPVLLGIGVFFGARAWINPLLAGLGLWLTYRLGKKLFDEKTGLLAAALTLTSPFFLMNSGSLLSHAWSLVLGEAFALAWLDSFPRAKFRLPLTEIVAGMCLGVLALTRPLSALGVALPFFIHGLILLWRGDKSIRMRVLLIGAISLSIAALTFAWQFGATGDPFLNPYTLWWPYDRIGFGPDIGLNIGGHTLRAAWDNTLFSLQAGWRDFFGWGSISWLFLPFGIWAVREKKSAWATLAIFPSLVVLYAAYWIGSWLTGPRYYYEGLPGLTLISAAGIFWLADFNQHGCMPWDRIRRAGVIVLVGALIGFNLIAYLPARLNGLFGLYGFERSRMDPFLSAEAQALTPALVIVYPAKDWSDYGTLLELENVELTSPFIFALYRDDAENHLLAKAYPDRRIIYYYPGDPLRFYFTPRAIDYENMK
jgi:hypothetical protein